MSIVLLVPSPILPSRKYFASPNPILPNTKYVARPNPILPSVNYLGPAHLSINYEGLACELGFCMVAGLGWVANDRMKQNS